MIVGVIMAVLSLGIAEVIAWQTKSTKYNRMVQTRNNLINTLISAARTPQTICRSLDTSVVGSTNDWLFTCVAGKPRAAASACYVSNFTPPGGEFKPQPLTLLSQSGDPIAGPRGWRPTDSQSAATAPVDAPVFFDVAGKQCTDPATAPNPDCVFKATANFTPSCRSGGCCGGPGCGPASNETAASVTVNVLLEYFGNVPGGAPLALASNFTSAIPVPVFQINNNCPATGGSVTQDTRCKPGQFMTGIDPFTGAAECGPPLPVPPPTPGVPTDPSATACKSGEALQGYRNDWTPICAPLDCPAPAGSTDTFLFAGFTQNPTTKAYQKNCLKINCPAGQQAQLGVDPTTKAPTTTCVRRPSSIVTYHSGVGNYVSSAYSFKVMSKTDCKFQSSVEAGGDYSFYEVPDSQVLWTGLSYAGSFTDAFLGQPQDLGSPGSCYRDAEGFDPMLLMSPFTENGSWNTSGDRSLWLDGFTAGDGYGPNGQVKPDVAMKNFSRCKVCEVPGEVRVLHHTDKCPAGWKRLWGGFGYLGTAFYTTVDGAGATGGDRHVPSQMTFQDLGGTGSCLGIPGPSFPHMWICGADNKCQHQNGNDFGFWLKSQSTPRQAPCVVCHRL